MTTKYEQYLERQRAQHGARFDPSELDPRFVRYYNSGERIKVRETWASGGSMEITGRVGITTGWRPVFLLLRSSRARGSSDLLTQFSAVVAVQRGRTYQPVTR